MRFLVGLVVGAAAMWALQYRDARRALSLIEAHRKTVRFAYGERHGPVE